MDKEQVAKRIIEIGIVPVVRATSAEKAMLAAEAVCRGGIPIVEVTMTVPRAIEAISYLAKKLGDDVLIGAGTVLDAETAERCVSAGAEFIVSPSLHCEVISKAKELGKVSIPGALTPTEVVTAWNAGADYVKVFPCSAVGGPGYLKALKAPLPHILLIPTGGVTLETASQYLKCGAVALGVGSDLVNASALAQGKPEIITDTAKKYLEIIRQERSQMANC